MPCYRYKFESLRLPLDYHGHVLPAPIVHIVLDYSYEMTVDEDAKRLTAKLQEMMSWLHNRKEQIRQRLLAYEVLPRREIGTQLERAATRRLLHRATVGMATALHGTPRMHRMLRPLYTVHTPRQRTRCPGYVLPEMANYT